MNRPLQWMLAAIMTICGIHNSKAQTADDTVYVFKADQPNAAYYLPAPPDTASLIFIDDMAQWQWGKKMRATKRGKQADRESLWLPDIMRTIMAEVLELDTISDEKTPALSRLLVKTYHTGEQSTAAAKKQYMRRRPFQQMNDSLWATYDTDFLRTNGSFPSGHASFGWATALVFAEMWPALQDTILRRGIQFGENRVITGAHWQSDVIAGLLCASASIARAHTNPCLEQDIQAARAEYARIKGIAIPDNAFAIEDDIPHGELILNNPVDTFSARFICDLQMYWNSKPVRDTKRGKTAEEEAEYSVAMMQKIMGEAIGITITDTETPAITRLISYVLDKSSDTADHLKLLRFRKRPFVQLGEPSSVPGNDENEQGKSSFPSGHTNLGWAEALVMAEVVPERQDEILRRGYEYGYNRIIVGYHWYTDVEATRPLASALVARLHADPEFRLMIKTAREEYETVTGRIIIENSKMEQRK